MSDTNAGRMLFNETPYRMWAFGAFFLVTSFPFVLGPFGLFTNLDQTPWWVRAFSVFVGLIGVAAGAVLMAKNPGTTIVLRRAPDALEIRRQWLLRRQEYQVLKSEIISVDLEETTGGDYDDPMWRVSLNSKRYGKLGLSMHWSRNKPVQQALRAAVLEFANLKQ